MKLILLPLFLFVFSQNGKSQNTALYLDSIFHLIIENRLVALDSNKIPISYQTIIHKYQHPDTAINCSWTRPKFINNIYHASFDGVVTTYASPDFDTSSPKSGSKFISFIEKIYDENGNYLGKKWAFMINRNKTPLSPNILRQKIIKGIKPHRSLSKMAKAIMTNGNEIWVNESIEINGNIYPNDSCVSKYYLRLNNHFEFEHNYDKDSFCTTHLNANEKVVGLEGDAAAFFKYAERVQYYKIENRTGYWSIEKTDSKDKTLLFYSKKGGLLAKYKLQLISPNCIVLNINNQKISLRKIIQKNR